MVLAIAAIKLSALLLDHLPRLRLPPLRPADASLTVGAGIVQELLKEGAVVVCPLRTQAEVDHLLEDCKGGVACAAGTGIAAPQGSRLLHIGGR